MPPILSPQDGFLFLEPLVTCDRGKRHETAVLGNRLPVPSRRPFRRCRRARLSIESRWPAVLVDGISGGSRLDAGSSGEPNPSAITHS